MSGWGIGTTATPVPTSPAPAPAPTYVAPAPSPTPTTSTSGYWIPDPNYMGDSSPPMIWVSVDPTPTPTPAPTITTGGSLLDQVLAMYQPPPAAPAPEPTAAPAQTSTATAPASTSTPGVTTGGAGSTTPIYTAPSANGFSFLDQVRQEALRLQAAGTLDAAITDNAGGTWQPNPHYTGDASPPMTWVPNPSPVPIATGPAPAPPAPPQLPFQAPTAADFATRNAPEMAQMQAGVQQQGLAPIPFAQRGMQNGLFAGATGGLPGAGTQNPAMSPSQLMQLLAQSGLMGGT